MRCIHWVAKLLVLGGLLALTGHAVSGDSDPPEGNTQNGENPLRLRTGIDRDSVGELALTSNEPIYLVIGGRGDSTGKVQFSFQYRIFDEDSEFVAAWPWLERMHFSYTQTAIWDLLGDSNPFKDTSYRPSLYWQRIGPQESRLPAFLRLGYEHESNGRDEDESRSVDSLFLFPGWLFEYRERQLLVGSKFHLPVARSEYNRDIHDYRGHVDFYTRYGNEDGFVTTAQLRYGKAGRGSIELTFSYPLRRPIFARTGGFFYLEIFHGHGETLLDYDLNGGTQLRVGLAIVR